MIDTKTQTTKRSARWNTIEWHRECHKNLLASLVRKKEEAERLSREVQRMDEDIFFYTSQINEAVKRGMGGFDSDKLLKRRTA